MISTEAFIKGDLNMKIKNISPAPYNPRKISDDKLALLGKSMREFGDLSGIVMNVETGNLIGGHQRIKHFDPSWPIVKRKHIDNTGTVALGEIDTPYGVWSYREVKWPKEKEIAANIAANQHGGEFDEPKLKQMLIELDDGMIDMTLTGFSVEEMRDLMESPIEEIQYEETELKPYKKTHILLSFPPEALIDIQEHLEKIIRIDGVEYEQSSN